MTRMKARRRRRLRIATGLLLLAGAGWGMYVRSSQAALTPAVASPAATSFEPTMANSATAPRQAPDGMVWIPGGEFSMGVHESPDQNNDGMKATADARPVHRVYVDGFFMDARVVTNAQFAGFVDATGYVTVAERTRRKEDAARVPLPSLAAGSVVFTSPPHEVPLDDPFQWWRWVKGADWRHPLGPASDLAGRDDYPVVQVAYEDAEAYATWAGRRLPTEAEWEFAARGGFAGQPFVWGDRFRPGGRWMANTHEGDFPYHDAGDDGFAGLAPVAQFPPNAYGLYDMAGNVWQWTSDWYRPDYYAQLSAAGVVARNPRGPDSSFDPTEPDKRKKVHRGGSFLCTDQYCSHYVVGARGKGEIGSGTNHLGFRTVMDRELAKKAVAR